MPPFVLLLGGFCVSIKEDGNTQNTSSYFDNYCDMSSAKLLFLLALVLAFSSLAVDAQYGYYGNYYGYGAYSGYGLGYGRSYYGYGYPYSSYAYVGKRDAGFGPAPQQ